MLTRSVRIAGPLDMRRTLRPLGLAWAVFDADGWWRSMRTAEGPATVHLRREGQDRQADGAEAAVTARAWGPGAAWVTEHIDQWIGAHDDPSAFQTEHPLIRELARRRSGMRFGRTGLMFEALLYAVLGQKVTGREAAAGTRGLTRRYSDPAPGPVDMRLPPDPARIAELAYHSLHDLGIEKRRADTLIALARRVRRIESLAGESPEEAGRVLRSFPGVGVWTVAETLVVTHGDADAVSVGDFHLKHIVSWNLAGEPRGTDERMLELLEGFRPHRGRVTRLLEGGGSGYPRYGPRRPIRSIAAI